MRYSTYYEYPCLFIAAADNAVQVFYCGLVAFSQAVDIAADRGGSGIAGVDAESSLHRLKRILLANQPDEGFCAIDVRVGILSV